MLLTITSEQSVPLLWGLSRVRAFVAALALWATLFGVSLLVSSTAPSVSAASAQCHAAIVIDRSGSVTRKQLTTMRNQIMQLFSFDDLYTLNTPERRDNVKLAFWSFSSTSSLTNITSNYDAPFAGYVGVNSQPAAAKSNFNTQLNSEKMQVGAGGTNYEQGFAYNQGKPNTFDNFQNLVDQTNIIVFMTDGLPNIPGNVDGGPLARNAARAAVQKHQDAGRIVIGALVGATNSTSLNFAINGNNNVTQDSEGNTNIFRISENYSDLARIMSQMIGSTCDRIVPPNPYTLTPNVTSPNNIATPGGNVTLDYTVDNTIERGKETPNTNWSVKLVKVDPGQSTEPIMTQHDNYSCNQVKASLNNKASCTDLASGSAQFGSGHSQIPNVPDEAKKLVIDKNYPVGTKVCLILTIDKPTNGTMPRDRYSRAYCFSIGKRPFVQVHGGDLRVGGVFHDDNSSDSDPKKDDSTPSEVELNTAGVVANTAAGAGDTLYGSWVEYGIVSAGPVVGMASMSGLQGGYYYGPVDPDNPQVPDTQSFWSKLTFANTDGEYGLYTQGKGYIGSIPDSAKGILASHSVVREDVQDISFSGDDVTSGIYSNPTGNINLGESTLNKNKSVVIYAPKGTVTVTGNIFYSDGLYTDTKELPQLVIIAKTISISPDVERIDGWLIANSKDDGTINTCNDTRVLTVKVCALPLTINGPVMARHLELRRTAGADASGGSNPDLGVAAPAEIINLPGSTLLWSQSAGKSEVRIQTTYTTELPPYF